jgi:hypothetical protein
MTCRASQLQLPNLDLTVDHLTSPSLDCSVAIPSTARFGHTSFSNLVVS